MIQKPIMMHFKNFGVVATFIHITSKICKISFVSVIKNVQTKLLYLPITGYVKSRAAN